MSNSIIGKTYTDHPLMDEIIYNCKLILKELVVKNDVLANNYETANTIQNAEYYMMILNGEMNFNVCPFTYEVLKAYGYNNELAIQCSSDRYRIPESDREALVEFTSKNFLDNFEEKNKYYRMLMGLPEYGTDEFDIYIDETYFPSNYNKIIDFTKPIHEMDNETIALLQSEGKIDELLSQYRGSNYSYLRFLGDKKLNLYNIRKASKWDILYIPSVEALVEDKFKEIYNSNKDVYLKRSYQEAYAFNSEYYEQCMILLVICQTFTDMIVDVPQWYIRRDIFDIRSVQYFLDSYGVKFFKEIPLKYQIRIVKNLNKLIKYKSSNKNNLDILEIFALKDTTIYKYYLYKKRLTDGYGNYLNNENESDNYELEFVQCVMGDTYDNYIKDQIYRTKYDDITYQDKYWDGEDTHQYIKDLHMNRDFTIEGSKYMSIEYKISMSEYLYQMQYFLGLLLDSNFDTDDLRIQVISIQPSVYFRLSDLFILLFLLSMGYDDLNTQVIRPEDVKESYKDNPVSDDVYTKVNYNERYYDWMKKYYPEIFVEPNNQVYGFNTSADLDKLSEIISRRHSQYQFDNGYTLKELGLENYQVPKKVSTIKELISLYQNNTKCYDNLKRIIVEETDDRDDYLLKKFVFNYLFTKDFDYKFYTTDNGTINAGYLEEVLEDKDFVLYNYYSKIMAENNKETKRDTIRNVINDIVSTLEYYLSGDGLDYIFSFTTIASFHSLLYYIYLMINFFKSYKVHFLDPYVTYMVDDPLENSAGAWDSISEKTIRYWKDDKEDHRDTAAYNVTLYHEDQAGSNHIIETVDIYGHFDPDPDDDYDYDGMYADSIGDYKDANGGYASDKSCIPFVVLNGGRAGLHVQDMWDLNGAGASEMVEYLDVDGGEALHLDDLKNDYFGKAFTYMIDAGGASTNNFFTKSMHVKVIDRQIESSVRVSQRQSNAITETEDGIYLQQQWTSWKDFNDFEEDTSSTFEYFSSMYNDLLDTLDIIDNPELLDEKIEKCISYYLEDARKVITYMDSNNFEENMKEYTDNKIAELYSEFYGFSPYQWEDF